MTLQFPHQKKFTVETYHQLAKDGLIAPGDRVELIEGKVIPMSPKGNKHSHVISRLIRAFATDDTDYLIRVQDPLSIPQKSEPEPDFLLLKWREDEYLNAHPKPDEVLLLIEVADSSLEFDRKTKVPLYATARISPYWIINLQDEVVEVYQNPSGNGYNSHEIKMRGTSLDVPTLKISIDADQVLPLKK